MEPYIQNLEAPYKIVGFGWFRHIITGQPAAVAGKSQGCARRCIHGCNGHSSSCLHPPTNLHTPSLQTWFQLPAGQPAAPERHAGSPGESRKSPEGANQTWVDNACVRHAWSGTWGVWFHMESRIHSWVHIAVPVHRIFIHIVQ